MAPLNDTMPFADMLPAAALQYVILMVPSITSTELKHQKTRFVIDQLADLYTRTNGTATNQSIVDTLQTTPLQLQQLVDSLGTYDDMQKLVLWASNEALPNAAHHTVRTGLLALIIIFTFWSCLTTGLRIYSRWKLPARIAVSDVVLVIGTTLAVLISFLFGADIINLTIQGSGAVWDITYRSFQWTQIFSTFESAFYHATVLCLKASILLFYLQLYVEKCVRYWVTIIILVLNVGTNLAGFFFLIFECHPVNYWDAWVTSTCVTNQAYAVFVFGIMNIFTDVVVWALPISMIWKVAITWQRRVLSVLVILSGVVACVASAIRVWLIWAGESEVSDGNMATFSVQICTILEVNLIVLCCNVPALRALGNFYLDRRTMRITGRPANFPTRVFDPEALRFETELLPDSPQPEDKKPSFDVTERERDDSIQGSSTQGGSTRGSMLHHHDRPASYPWTYYHSQDTLPPTS